MNLAKLQQRWIELYDELGGTFEGKPLAAPFISVPEGASSNGANRPILIVGKATAGPWGTEQFDDAKTLSPEARLAERRKYTRDHLEMRNSADNRPSGFWRFRRDLERISELVVWTNLSKLGTKKGNPKWRFLYHHSDLACRTLTAEIQEYKPSLIVLVTQLYGRHEVVWKLFGKEDQWEIGAIKGLRWQESSRAFDVPVMWTEHPERKASPRIEPWLEKARELYHI